MKPGQLPTDVLDKKLNKLTTPDRPQIGGGMGNPQFNMDNLNDPQKMRANVGSADP
jgi:hypothetical protein